VINPRQWQHVKHACDLIWLGFTKGPWIGNIYIHSSDLIYQLVRLVLFQEFVESFLQAMVIFQELRIQANNKPAWIVGHIFTPN
jgi:hypothetical protein